MTLVLVSNLLKLEEDGSNLKSYGKESREKGLLVGRRRKYKDTKMELNGGKGSQTKAESLKDAKDSVVEKGEVGRSSSFQSAGVDTKKQPCVVTYVLPDAQPDGQWGLVISHGAGEVNKSTGAPVILRVVPQFASSLNEGSKSEKVTGSQAHFWMEMESFANDNHELITPNADDEAQLTAAEAYEEEDMMKKTMGSTTLESSPNCTAEIYPPILGFESGDATVNTLLNGDKSQNDFVPNAVVDDDPKSDGPTTDFRSSSPKLRNKPRRSSRLMKSMEGVDSDSIKVDNSTDTRMRPSLPSLIRRTRSQSQKDMASASLSPCDIVLARYDNPLGNKGPSVKKSTGLSSKNTPTRNKNVRRNQTQKVRQQVLQYNVDSSGRPICSICSRTFINIGSLRSHLLTHTNERPHKCPLCYKSFRQVGTRNRHVILKHKTKVEKPYDCPEPECSRSFWQKGSLKVHMYVHTKEKPYRCPECPQVAYASRTSLNRHIKLNH